MNILEPLTNKQTPPRRQLRPGLEPLEARLTLSTIPAVAAAVGPGEIRSLADSPTVLGTISGRVTNATSGQALRHVEVDLINPAGRVVRSTFTSTSGGYAFPVRSNGAYVVHVDAPGGFKQASPSFPNVKPTGSYAPGAGGSSWTYSGGNTDPASGPVDPYAWDTIAPAGKLPFQSPINITTPAVNLSRVLSVNYNPAVPTHIVNNGHQFQVQFPTTASADTITVNGVTSSLAQFHYHAPAETRIHGRAYPMEEHFVNMSAAGGLTVLTVFLKQGAHNNALDPILAAAAANLLKSNSTTPGTVPVDFKGLLPASRQGWFYEGSLTTPPLSQPVNWFVFQTPITLDAGQLAEYTRIATAAGFDPNARPDQPLDGRRLNEIDYDVNFQNTSVPGLNFAIARR